MFVKIKNSAVVLVLISLIYFSVCFSGCKKNAASVTDTSVLNVVKTVKVEKKPYNEDLNSFGTVSYKTKNNVTVLVEGTLEKWNVKEGDFVQKGQILGKMRNVQMEIQKDQAVNSLETSKVSLFQAQTSLQDEELSVESRILSIQKSELNLEQLKLELEEARLTLEKNKELLEIGGVTESSYKNMELSVRAKETEVSITEKEIEISRLGMRDEDLLKNGYKISEDPEEKIRQLVELNTRSARASVETAKSNLSSSQKNLDSIEKLLEELTIRAPVSGVVGALNFANGEYVPQNESVMVIMDVSEVYAVFSIHEQDIQYFNVGDAITVELPSVNKYIKTKLSEISPIADSTSGNFTVKALLSNKDSSIKPGMFVKCTVLRNDQTPMCAFPETCLVQKDGESGFVFAVVNNLAALKQVKIVKEKDGYIWVTNGVKEKDVLIDKPSPFLKEGERVETR